MRNRRIHAALFFVLMSFLAFTFQNCSSGGGGGAPGAANFVGGANFQAPTYVTQWGSLGSYRQQATFQTPGAILWANGLVHVSDGFANQWVQKFDANGVFQSTFGVPTPVGAAGSFSEPIGMDVDAAGNIYVVDSPQHRIQVFNSSGAFVREWGSQGAGNGLFNYPYGVAVYGSTVYVSDTVNDLVQVFDTSGTFIGQFGSGLPGPTGIAVDSSGNVYVANGNHNVKKFSATGTYLATIGGQTAAQGDIFLPMGIAFGPDDRLYVASSSRNSISVFTTDGTFLGKWGSLGSGDGEFNRPVGVTVDSSNNVYVLDAGNYRVQKFGAPTVIPPGGTPIPSGPFRLVISRLPRPKNSTSGADAANGSTTSSPAGITCTNCYTTYASVSGTVTLNTALNVGTNSISWGGDCVGNTVVMDADKYCTFLYTDNSSTYLATSGTMYTLRVSKTAGGTGTVASSPAGINCGTACMSTTTTSAYGAGGTLFTLTATASSGSTFVRWTGDCSGTNATTTTTLSQNRHCVAVFTTP